jgi:hypothetical protein
MIYFVESPDDDSVRLAVDLRIEEGPKGRPVISWSDTTRRRVFEVFEFQTPVRVLQRPEPHEVRFTSMSGRLYRLTPLTLRLYNDFVRETVHGQPVFSSDAEVQRFYHESFGWESAHRNPMRG